MTTVFILVFGKASDPEDEDIGERFRIELNDDVPHEHRANAALDVFHANVPVNVLDDFTFLVTDADERTIDEAADVEQYLYRSMGTATPDPIPEPSSGSDLPDPS